MEKALHVEIVSPTGSVFRGRASGVRAPGVDGSFEVRFNHAPMIAAFDIGPILVMTAAGDRVAFATSGGFLEVLDNQVTVLAETAEPASEIDVDRARAAEARAREILAAADPEEKAIAAAKLERARNRVRLAVGSVGSRVSG